MSSSTSQSSKRPGSPSNLSLTCSPLAGPTNRSCTTIRVSVGKTSKPAWLMPPSASFCSKLAIKLFQHHRSTCGPTPRSITRSRNPARSSAEAAVSRPADKSQSPRRQPRTTARKPPVRRHHGNLRTAVPDNCRRNNHPHRTTRQSSRSVRFVSFQLSALQTPKHSPSPGPPLLIS